MISSLTPAALPQQRTYNIAWNDSGRARGSNSLQVITEDHQFAELYSSKQIDLASPAAKTALRDLVTALAAFDPALDQHAQVLSPSWYRRPTAAPGQYAIGVVHVDSEPRMHYGATAGAISQASDGARLVLDRARAVWKFAKA